MIGFLLWVRARNTNHELRRRLAKYEPPPPPPPSPSTRAQIVFAVVMVIFIGMLMLSGPDGHRREQPSRHPGVVVAIPQPRPVP
jgi:hypothetical protein